CRGKIRPPFFGLFRAAESRVQNKGPIELHQFVGKKDAHPVASPSGNVAVGYDEIHPLAYPDRSPTCAGPPLVGKKPIAHTSGPYPCAVLAHRYQLALDRQPSRNTWLAKPVGKARDDVRLRMGADVPAEIGLRVQGCRPILWRGG